MPSIKYESRLRLRSRNSASGRDPLAPTPVRPRSLKCHGLFGLSIASQHLIVDDNWSPKSLCDQFAGITDLLRRRLIYKRHEVKTNRQRLLKHSKHLKRQCNDGRIKLQKLSYGNTALSIRNSLIRHRDMQRLYQKMPIHLVADNINQRTFVMRKEKDRLEFRLSQAKRHYRELLLERSKVQNLVKYKFKMDEELQSRILLKKIENSKVRMRAIRIINITYRKMIQVLSTDEIFYEPILRSLDGDMEDQVNFIKHILYLGMPAISKFRHLNRKFCMLEVKSRQNLQDKTKILESFKTTQLGSKQQKRHSQEMLSASPDRYVRATESMLLLKMELETIEKTIKELKQVALCSQARDIYVNVKNQVDSNEKLHHRNEHERQTREMLNAKMNYATVLQGVLVNNLSASEMDRIEVINDLRKKLKADQEIEQEHLEFIKNRADAFVMFRICIWNLMSTLRHVHKNPRTFDMHYPNSYLKLPLLKFEMFNVYASAPECYESDMIKLMNTLKRKVIALTKKYTVGMEANIATSKINYHDQYMETVDNYQHGDDDDDQATAVGEDLLQGHKIHANIPNRKHIKASSARILEEVFKRDSK